MNAIVTSASRSLIARDVASHAWRSAAATASGFGVSNSIPSQAHRNGVTSVRWIGSESKGGNGVGIDNIEHIIGNNTNTKS